MIASSMGLRACLVVAALASACAAPGSSSPPQSLNPGAGMADVNPLRPPEANGVVASRPAPRDAQREGGGHKTLTLQGSDTAFQVGAGTPIQISRGKLVDKGTASDFKTGDRVSVWYHVAPAGAPPTTTADKVMIFRAGTSDFPHP
jgi:hypothetical protein